MYWLRKIIGHKLDWKLTFVGFFGSIFSESFFSDSLFFFSLLIETISLLNLIVQTKVNQRSAIVSDDTYPENEIIPLLLRHHRQNRTNPFHHRHRLSLLELLLLHHSHQWHLQSWISKYIKKMVLFSSRHALKLSLQRYWHK